MDILHYITILLSWLIIFVFILKIAKKKEISWKNWRLYVVLLLGLFSIDYTFSFLERKISIAIFPLGMWILYIFLHKKEGAWLKYRTFAWLGFWSNYLFLMTYLFSWPIYYLLYPSEDLATYLSNPEEVRVIAIHPTAKEQSKKTGALKKELPEFKRDEFFTVEWYNETYFNSDSTKAKERFPYLLVDHKSKWGSGIESTIYLEKDGKGVLVSTSKNQYYFRSDHSIIKGGSNDE